MKRFVSALFFCIGLLVALSFVMFPPVRAKEDPIAALLQLPAPPPPNPMVISYRTRDKKFYDKSAPPNDNAATDEILDYWKTQSDSYAELGFNPKPSDRITDRIMSEIEKDHDLLTHYLNVLPDGERSANFVKDIYDHEGKSGVFDRDERATIKNWLMYHSSMFSNELADAAGQIRDADEYVTSQAELLALTKVDFDKAQPIISRLYNDSSQKVSQTLAKWALYKHALDTDSIGDIDRYRDELKAVVEDKNATPGMRDLALDALVKEKDWSGRDDWYYSLLGDETLADLKVGGRSYTGLTTLMYYAPDDKYIDKMVELLKSDNKAIRAAAIRNLLLKLDTANIEIVRAMVPWLEDPKWANDTGNSRQILVSKLAEYEIPESVPGLIKVLDEKHTTPSYAANTAANVARYPNYNYNAMASAANAMANAANTATGPVGRTMTNANAKAAAFDFNEDLIYNNYPMRDSAIMALAKQKDQRAVPSLRRILPEMEYYQQTTVVKALIACNGFSLGEQIEGLEIAAKGVRSEMDGQPAVDPLANLYQSNSNVMPSSLVANGMLRVGHRVPSPFELKAMVGRELVNSSEISDELARAVVDRIEVLDKSNKPLADAFRRMTLRWQGPTINLLMLHDLKRGVANSEAIVKLLSVKKDLREKQSTDVYDVRTGVPMAVGISACLLDDQADAASIIENGDTEAKTALLACARLVRLPLSIDKVAANLESKTPILSIAAERYLESEDSPTARSIVLARHPGEARIMGATSAFFVSGGGETSSEMLYGLYQSLDNNSLYNGWAGSGNDSELTAVEKSLQDEVKKTDGLIAVYAYDSNFVRMYKDRVMFSWEEDASRYRERPMTKHEFEDIKAYIHDNKLDELPPFLNCGGDYCSAKELLMLGKNGGRRVYVNGDSNKVFEGLDAYFTDLKKTPATLRYTLSRDIPGLEIVIATDDLHAETVWKDGGLRIAASLTAVRKKVDEDVDKISDEEDPTDGTVDVETRKQQLRDKREYDGYGWYRITANGAEPGAPQPAGVEFVPIFDGLAVKAGSEQWKTRAPGFEVRSSEDGLFKVVRGRIAKIKSGNYSDPLVTPNGRWLIATKTDTEGGSTLVRIDLVTNKESVVEIPNGAAMFASAFVPTANRVLLADRLDYYNEGPDATEPDDTVPADHLPDQMMLLDAATGDLQPVAGEFRPLDQQTFRPLQATGRPGEFWAAISDSEKNETQIGVYETKTFGFKPILTVPKIRFNSMSMWVDEAGNKVYFVYRGHLLALPPKGQATGAKLAIR